MRACALPGALPRSPVYPSTGAARQTFRPTSFGAPPAGPQVDGVLCQWGAVMGAVAQPADAYDLYARQAGLLGWLEDEVEEEEEE